MGKPMVVHINDVKSNKIYKRKEILINSIPQSLLQLRITQGTKFVHNLFFKKKKHKQIFLCDWGVSKQLQHKISYNISIFYDSVF